MTTEEDRLMKELAKIISKQSKIIWILSLLMMMSIGIMLGWLL